MANDLTRQLFKSAVLNASAYHVPDSVGLIKLDAMENPYTWPDNLKQQWLDNLSRASLNRYPDAATSEMRSALRKLFEVPDDAGMMFGNGSDELIQIILMALAQSAATVLTPEPTFVMYRHLSEMLDIRFVGVPLQKDFSLDIPGMLKAIKEHNPSVIFLAWPNNPTGNIFSRGDIETIIKASDGLVVIDEAYHVFARQTMMPVIEHYPNVLVMRTLSKLGLAGLRLGSLVGQAAIISELEKIRLPYNIGTLNQLSVNFICQHIDVLYQQAEQILESREDLYRQLSEEKEIRVWPTEANFILFRCLNKNATDVHAELMKNKILIKNLSTAHPLLENCLRVTVGKPEENEAFIKALKEILQN